MHLLSESTKVSREVKSLFQIVKKCVSLQYFIANFTLSKSFEIENHVEICISLYTTSRETKAHVTSQSNVGSFGWPTNCFSGLMITNFQCCRKLPPVYQLTIL